MLLVALSGLLGVLVAAQDPVEDKWFLVALASVAVVALLVLLATDQAARLHFPAMRFWSGTASVVISRPPHEVWSFIRTADTAPLLQSNIHRAFTVPGTPDGVGEEQAFICDGPDGGLCVNVLEVVQEEPGVSASVRAVTGAPIRQRYQVAASPGGSLLTFTTDLSAARWAVHTVHPRKQAQAEAERYVASVKGVMESHPRAWP